MRKKRFNATQKIDTQKLKKFLENKALEINKENLMSIAGKYKKSKISHNDDVIISMK